MGKGARKLVRKIALVVQDGIRGVSEKEMRRELGESLAIISTVWWALMRTKK